MSTAPISKYRPGDRLAQTIWFKALSSKGRVVMPTVERVNAIRCLVAAWQASDDAEASNDTSY